MTTLEDAVPFGYDVATGLEPSIRRAGVPNAPEPRVTSLLAESTNGDAPVAFLDPRWPSPPDEDAFHGLAGRIVRLIEPHSEADPVALLLQALVAAGNAMGRSAHVAVEADRHFPNLYAVLVGETSKARKGTSWGHVERVQCSADSTFMNRVESGLSSGEGLIERLRDSSGEDGEPVPVDKRLLVVETELANVLRVLERQGNRLSIVVRDGWDGRPLSTLTRAAVKVIGACISIIGHITEDELRRYLTVTESANGFGNRFIWCCVRRSKVLPDGGQMHRVNIAPVAGELRDAIRFAGTLGRVERDAEARELWHDVYPELSEGRPGLVGALTGRAEAQVTRLALVYALLDTSTEIKVEHLQAALALWDYSARSVRHVFGASLGDPIADTILEALRRAHPSLLSRTDIRGAVGGRTEAAAIERGLALLFQHKLAAARRIETGGRPAEHWHLTEAGAKR